eukprot:2337829-Pyramimonas_sp.AAC.1
MLDQIRGKERRRDTPRPVRLRQQEVTTDASAVLQGHNGGATSRKEVPHTLPWLGSRSHMGVQIRPRPLPACATSL